jgi:hypothetical protein
VGVDVATRGRASEARAIWVKIGGMLTRANVVAGCCRSSWLGVDFFACGEGGRVLAA